MKDKSHQLADSFRLPIRFNSLLRKLQNLDEKSFESGQIYTGSGFGHDPKVRHCASAPQGQNKQLEPLVKYLINRIQKNWKNNKKIKFDHALVAKYSKGDFFDWHLDDSHSSKKRDNSLPIRIYSCVLSLSNESDFTGGQLEIALMDGSLYHPKLSAPGECVIFLAKFPHRVTKIRRGIRTTLVIWFAEAGGALSQ